ATFATFSVSKIFVSFNPTLYRRSTAESSSTRSSEVKDSSDPPTGVGNPSPARKSFVGDLFFCGSSNSGNRAEIAGSLGLPEEVRGKSTSGQTAQEWIRWYSANFQFTRATTHAHSSSICAEARAELSSCVCGKNTAHGSMSLPRFIGSTTQSRTCRHFLSCASRSSG